MIKRTKMNERVFKYLEWTPLSFKRDELMIKVKFSDPLLLSQGSGSNDYLQMSIMNDIIFQSKDKSVGSSIKISDESRITKHRI